MKGAEEKSYDDAAIASSTTCVVLGSDTDLVRHEILTNR